MVWRLRSRRATACRLVAVLQPGSTYTQWRVLRARTSQIWIKITTGHGANREQQLVVECANYEIKYARFFLLNRSTLQTLAQQTDTVAAISGVTRKLAHQK